MPPKRGKNSSHKDETFSLTELYKKGYDFSRPAPKGSEKWVDGSRFEATCFGCRTSYIRKTQSEADTAALNCSCKGC